MNAAFDRLWPEKETAQARMEVVRRLRMKALMPRLRRDDEEQERFADDTEPEESAETVLLNVPEDEQADVEPTPRRPA